VTELYIHQIAGEKIKKIHYMMFYTKERTPSCYTQSSVLRDVITNRSVNWNLEHKRM